MVWLHMHPLTQRKVISVYKNSHKSTALLSDYKPFARKTVSTVYLGFHMEKYTLACSNTCMFFVMAAAFFGKTDTALGQEHHCVLHVCNRFSPPNSERVNPVGMIAGILQVATVSFCFLPKKEFLYSNLSAKIYKNGPSYPFLGDDMNNAFYYDLKI